MSFSVLMNSTYFSDSLIEKVRQLLDSIETYDKELHEEQCRNVIDLVSNINKLVIQKKATVAAVCVTEILEEFYKGMLTRMVDSAADIETGRVDLLDALLKTFPQYPRAWAIFDDEKFAIHSVIEMKKGLFEKQKNTFATLKEEAKKFKAIPVLVTSCGASEGFALKIRITDADVRHVKQQIAQKWCIPEDEQVLICCGEVLEDDVELSQSQVYLEHERLWVVWRDVWCNRKVYKFVHFHESDTAKLVRQAVALDSCMSGMDIKQWTALFSLFCRVIHDYNFSKWTWNPSIAVKAALNSTKCALENMVGLSDFPQVRWYVQYGCALLVLNPVPDRLLLQVRLSLFQNHVGHH